MDFTIEEGIKATEQALATANLRTEDENPQIALFNWKQQVNSKAKERAKAIEPRIQRQITELTQELTKILNDPDIGDHEKIKGGKRLTEEIARLEQKRHSLIRQE
ncbi:hypothetical protein V5O48_019449, partial [Marasmius crinis-equi]